MAARSLFSLLRRSFGRFVPASAVIQEWEWYARDYARENSSAPVRLGVEWNRPDVVGVDASADALVQYLDRELIAPLLGTPEVVLEIGSGGGRFTEVLLARAKRVIAADASPTMLKLLKRRFSGRENVDYLLLDGSGAIPLPSHSVDAAFSYDVFVHLRHWDVFLYLVELRRVLKPGGCALVHHPNTFSELGWRKFLADAAAVQKKQTPKAGFTIMTPELMEALAARSGLSVERSVTDLVRRDCVTLLRAGPG